MFNQVHQSHPYFDNERAIIESETNVPSPIPLTGFQEQIDKIVGRTPYGQSRVRILWGQDVEKGSMFTLGKRRLKYPFWHFKAGEEIRDIGVPRFYIEELHTNEELMKDDKWEKARYQWHGGVCEDVLGPIPLDGFYTGLFIIAYHDDTCCGGREIVKHQPCYGSYREPGEQDLTRIRRMLFMRNQASRSEIAPSDEEIHRQAKAQMEARDEHWRQGIRGVTEDFLKTHAWRFVTSDPSKLSWGKYHFTGEGHSRSGLSPLQLARLRDRAKVDDSQSQEQANVSNSSAA